MDVHVRLADLADPNDAEAVRDMTQAYASDPQGAGAPLPDATIERLIPAMAAHPAILVFLAFHDGRPVGIATCLLSFSTFAAKPILNIHDLSVVPEFRGRGVSRRLVEAVEAQAVCRGCSRLTLEVSARNGHARRVYASLGFRGAVDEDAEWTTFFCTKPLGDGC